MKISKKILASNLTIGFVVTILLSLMILYVSNNFIRDNAFYNMEKEVNRMAEILKYQNDENLVNRNDFISKPSPRQGISTGHVFIILDSNGALIRHTDYTYEDDVDDSFYEDLNNSKPGEYTNLQLGKYPVVTYKIIVSNPSESGESDVQIVGLVYNSLLYKLVFDLIVPVLIALFIVVLLSFIISAIYGRKITEPVELLIQMTEKISKKEIVKANIKSGDEFEVISKAMEKMSEELFLKDIESKQFYEHISHDLKTPLTIISGYAEGISNGIFENNEEPLNKIVNHCDRLKHQIEDVIYLSQLETNKQIFELGQFAIEDVINEVLDDFEVIFLKKDIEVNYHPINKTMVEIDYSKMVRVISNIILNATKYTESEISIKINQIDREVKVAIYDNGPGFSPQILEDPFKGYYENNESGNGIGLMIVYKIMDAHKGLVNISNTKVGAMVELVFPKK